MRVLDAMGAWLGPEVGSGDCPWVFGMVWLSSLRKPSRTILSRMSFPFSRASNFSKNIWSISISWLELLPDMSARWRLLPGLNMSALMQLPSVPAPKKHWGVGVHGSKVKVADLVPLEVTEHSGIAKSALVGAGHDIWGGAEGGS
jgi:hypothetical protein